MFVEILVGSKVRSGPVLKTNTADSFLNMIFENHNGFLMDFFFIFAILFLKLLKPASVLGRLGAGCSGLPSSGLALLVPACVLGRLEAGCDDDMSSSESESAYSGTLSRLRSPLVTF